MQRTELERRFTALKTKRSEDDYNFEHFRTKHLIKDALRTVTAEGIEPGETAPDFELPQVGGGAVRLSDLRGKPVVLHFGSYS